MNRTTVGPKRIAKMIKANCDAVHFNRITWDQFLTVNAATWELVTKRQIAAVQRYLDRMERAK